MKTLEFNAASTYDGGYVILKTSTARGGVSYTRQTIDEQELTDGGDQRRLVTDIRRDSPQMIKESEALVKKGDYVLRTHCVDTIFGWFCQASALAAIEADFKPLRLAAEQLNAAAAKLGSGRRVHLGYIKTKLILDAAATTEISTTIVEALQRFHAALRDGRVRDVRDANGAVLQRDQVRAAEIAHANLIVLTIGFARDLLKLALDSIRPAKAAVIAAIDAGQPPAKAGRLADLGALENAIGFFTQGLEG